VPPQVRIAYRGRIAQGIPPSVALSEALPRPCCGTALLAFEDLQREVDHPGFPSHRRAEASALLAKAVTETRVFDPHPRHSRPFAPGEVPFAALAAVARPEVYLVPLAGARDGRPLFKLGSWGELQRLPGLQERIARGKRELDAALDPIADALTGAKDI
jgi:hypothetical protein